jgi:hypothetical protein
MKTVRRALLFAAVLVGLLAANAPQLQAVSGTWKLERNLDGRVQLELFAGDRIQSMHWQETMRLDSAPSSADFTVAREAGTFHFTGTMGNGSGGGNFTFTPSPAFVAGLQSRGLDYRHAENLMSAASIDLTLAYIDSIRANGYPSLDFDQLMGFRAVGATPQSIAQLRGIFGAMSADDVISTHALHVTPAYVAELRSMNVGRVTPERAVTFKSLKITKAYIAELGRMGYAGLSADQIVTFRAMHIDAAYVRHLAAHGLTHLTADQVIQMKAAGL